MNDQQGKFDFEKYWRDKFTRAVEKEPGESTQGLIGFLVPEDGDGLVFVFDRDMFDFGKVFISLD